MPLQVLRFKSFENEEDYRKWQIHTTKVFLVIFVFVIVAIMLSMTLNFAAYYKAQDDNEKLIVTIKELNSRLVLSAIEREAYNGRSRALETALLSKSNDKETKDKILTINAVVSEFIADSSKNPDKVEVNNLKDDICSRLEEKQVSCYP